MKKFWSVILIFSCIAFFSIGDALAKKPSPKGEKAKNVKTLSHSGNIEGEVQCSDGSDVDGTLVSVLGLSITAKTDSSGDFKLLYVPKGTYEIVFEVPGKLAESVSVEVIKKRVTELNIVLNCDPEL